MTAGSVVSVNVGKPKNVTWNGKTVYTGVWKYPVEGPAMVRRLNVDGDGQGDTGGHGGEQRAVMVYQLDSYRYWQEYFGRDDFTYGQFGENFTVEGMPDDEVCIGDRYRIGKAEFEVTQPRVTCYRVGMRMGEPELPSLLVAHHRPGFYLRVITEGEVQAGDEIVKTRTGPEALTVAEIDALLYLPDRDPSVLRRATRIPALSPGWQGSFRDLLEPPVASEPSWNGFRQLQVADVVPESSTVSSIYLASTDGTALPAAVAGQYLTLRVGAGVRSYSLSTTDGYRISVKHEPYGSVSGYLTTDLQKGAVIDVAAPRGDFVLDRTDGPVLLISAGIGLTPVLAMLHQLAGSEREVWWIHSARSPKEHALAEEARGLLASMPHAHEHVFYTSTTGRLTKDKVLALGFPVDASAYLCGPEAFMTDMREALVAAGLGSDRIHSELFGALGAINPGIVGHAARPPHQPDGPPATGPMVTFVRSGISTPFGSGNLLELAEACDVPARWSCRTGVCHTCVTPLLSGEVTYSPTPLEPAPDGQALICCARPTSDVVLDM